MTRCFNAFSLELTEHHLQMLQVLFKNTMMSWR